MKKLIVSQSNGDTFPKFHKLLIVMKLTAILLIVVCLQASATGYSQNDVSISVKNVELKKLFNILQKSTHYRFLYEDKQLPGDMRVNVAVENVSIQTLLNDVLRNTLLHYRVLNNNLVVLSNAAVNEIKSSIIKGRITDESGQPLQGVSIRLKGSNSGVSTGADGAFFIEVPDNSVLEISFIGYITQELSVKKDENLNIQLVPGDKNLDEVVVVGFGTQKKVNLTGAVDMITAKQLESRPLTSLGAGLQGLIPNLNISISNGRATTGPAFNIRGFTSINGGEPLIVVDNVPFTMDEVSRLNPNDIESVSVLKDAASAAIYGARASFGVVLISTKAAKGNKLNVSVNSFAAIRTIGKLPELVTDPYLVMENKHEAGRPLYNLFPDAARAYAKQRSEDPSLPAVILNPANPDYWLSTGSTNWLDEAYNKTGPTYNTNLSVSKRADKMAYYLSADYYRQDGMLKYGNDIYNRYNLRGKIDLNITRWLDISNNTLITSSDYKAPVLMDADFFWNVNRQSSLDVPKNPDGSWSYVGGSLLGRMQEGGRSQNRLNEFQTTFSANISLIKGVWDIKGDATIRRGSGLTRSYDIPIPYKTGPDIPVAYTGATTSWAQNNTLSNRYNVYNVYTNFHKNFGNHFVQGLVGFNQEYKIISEYTARRNNIISTSLPSIGLSTGTMTQNETLTDWAMRGVFYRLGYNYKERYLLELNGRYDGSSRFPGDRRWGFFPSASAGWVISDEAFFKGINKALSLDVFKIRASYGSLGNQTFAYNRDFPYYDSYPYLPILPTGQANIILGSTKPTIAGSPKPVSDNFSWESIASVNFGVDLSMFKNRFNVNFDKYTRYTRDMLIPGQELPAVFGADAPTENNGDLKTKGWELRLNWRDNITLAGSPFWYNLTFTLADNRSWITKYDNPTKYLGNTYGNYYEGREIGEIWGAEIAGYFKDEQEIINSPNQRDFGEDDQGYNFYPGDLKFVDLNHDGKINYGDRTVDNPGDMHIVGNKSARYPYGIDLSAGWKGLDLRVFMQGIGKRDWYPGNSNVYFWGIYAQPWTNVTTLNLDHWTPENPNAYFPAVRAYTAEDALSPLAKPNQRYMQNGAYMRVKNVTIGYALPQSLLQRLNLSKVRFYFSAENIFEISHLKVKLDPESLGDGSRPQAAYPFQRTYSFGVNLNF